MRRRINLFLFGFSIGIFGCHKHVAAPTYDAVHRSTYVYQRLNEGEFIVAAKDGKALKQALEEIGCGTKYICESEKFADWFDVQVHSK